MFTRSSNQIIFALSLYCLLLFNFGFWRIAWQSRDALLLATLPVFLLAAFFLILQLFFWPLLHRLLMPVFILCGSGIAYAVWQHGIYFNADMLQNVFQTDRAEAAAWLSGTFALWLVLTGLLPACIYFAKVRIRPAAWYKALARRLIASLIAIVLIAATAAVAYPHYAAFFRNHSKIFHQIVPVNLISASGKSIMRYRDSRRPFLAIGLDAEQKPLTSTRKRVLVVVIGETTRAQNWGLNPGAPATTPRLADKADLINYPDVSACGTATAISVPCMFSNMPRSQYDAATARHQEGLLDILQRAGLTLRWYENDGGCKGVCDRIPNRNIRDLAAPEDCGFEGCLDITLLKGLDEGLNALNRNNVILLHTMGSHGPAYYQRYPEAFRRFTPTCDSNQIQHCSREALENTYNNTILYIDHMLASTIERLNAQPEVDAALLYVSDHGESLGERGMYLHAAPYAIAPAEQTHIPMIFWANDGWYRATGLSRDCLQTRAAQPYSHDHFFHSILGITEVQTTQYQAEWDLFAPCRTS